MSAETEGPLPEELPLPELQDAELDPATLQALIGDLATSARLLSVRRREDGERASLSATSEGLQEGLALLRRRETLGLQIRYEYERALWCDTLMALPGGNVRLVRMRG